MKGFRGVKVAAGTEVAIGALKAVLTEEANMVVAEGAERWMEIWSIYPLNWVTLVVNPRTVSTTLEDFVMLSYLGILGSNACQRESASTGSIEARLFY